MPRGYAWGLEEYQYGAVALLSPSNKEKVITSRIAVIGSGNVGGALGRRFAELGIEVVFGVRDPLGTRAIAAVSDAPGSSAIAVPKASERCDVVVLAVPLDGLDDVLGQIGSLAGKTVIDAVNAVRHPPPGGFPSVAHYVADRLPGAMVAKAFNTVGFEVMLEPIYPTGRAVMPIAGHDGARPIADELARLIGFDVLDLGGIDSAQLVEAWASVWIRSMMAGRGRTLAFGVLER